MITGAYAIIGVPSDYPPSLACTSCILVLLVLSCVTYFITMDTFGVGRSVTFLSSVPHFQGRPRFLQECWLPIFFCFPLCDHFSSQVIFSDFATIAHNLATIGVPPGHTPAPACVSRTLV